MYRKGLASGLFQHQSINNTSKRKADIELHSCCPVESRTKKTSTAIYIACITPFSLVYGIAGVGIPKYGIPSSYHIDLKSHQVEKGLHGATLPTWSVFVDNVSQTNIRKNS